MRDDGPAHWCEETRSWLTRDEVARLDAKRRLSRSIQDRRDFHMAAKRPQELELLEFAP